MVNDTQVETWLDERQVAKIIGMSLSWLRQSRFKGTNIPYSKVGRSVRYALSDVLAFLLNRRVQTQGSQAHG